MRTRAIYLNSTNKSVLMRDIVKGTYGLNERGVGARGEKWNEMERH